MNPIEAVGSFFSNYVNCSGRATRSEYWWCYLLIALGYIGVMIVSMIAMMFVEILGMVLIFAYGIAIIAPFLALSVRRLHDTNRSGWWLLLLIVPFGGIVIFIFDVMPSTVGSNNYGPQS
jgi:uncharacterized membrane protein YhaH (DUF805 family)